MNFFVTIEERWQVICEKTQPARQKAVQIARTIKKYAKITWAYIYKLRSVILAVPVAIGAIWLACMNMAKLPSQVGIHLLSTGEFETMVPKLVAVLGPLALTVFCIILTLCSRKTLYPWLVSLFTLAVPLLFLVTNVPTEILKLIPM